jgi:chemotaxis protein MotD
VLPVASEPSVISSYRPAPGAQRPAETGDQASPFALLMDEATPPRDRSDEPPPSRTSAADDDPRVPARDPEPSRRVEAGPDHEENGAEIEPQQPATSPESAEGAENTQNAATTETAALATEDSIVASSDHAGEPVGPPDIPVTPDFAVFERPGAALQAPIVAIVAATLPTTGPKNAPADDIAVDDMAGLPSTQARANPQAGESQAAQRQAESAVAAATPGIPKTANGNEPALNVPATSAPGRAPLDAPVESSHEPIQANPAGVDRAAPAASDQGEPHRAASQPVPSSQLGSRQLGPSQLGSSQLGSSQLGPSPEPMSEQGPQAPDGAPKPGTAPTQALDTTQIGSAEKPSADVPSPTTQPHQAESPTNLTPGSVSGIVRSGAAETGAIYASSIERAAVPVSGLALEITARAQGGSSRFEIRLDPPDLGRVDVRLEVDRHGQVTSRLVVERAETLDLLRRDAPELERALQQAGLKTGDGGLQFSLRDQASGGRNQDANGNAARLVVHDPEMTPVETVTSSYGRSLGVGTGIDIRV